jgi:hypothetical protein
MNSNNRVQLYRASYKWDAKDFKLTGFYRTGITIGLMKAISLIFIKKPIIPNIDIYNGEAPFGFEIEGKKALKGLKVAFERTLVGC